MHPSKKIVGTVSKELLGKSILLGVTGSISLYRSLDLARALMRRGGDVKVIMSQEAVKLISPEMFKWATGNNVISQLTGDLEHVELAEENDGFLIAPATANTVVKLAEGVADSPLVSTALNFMGSGKPVCIVPAMHLPMYQSPQVKRALGMLREMSVKVIEPEIVNDLAHYPDVELITWSFIVQLLRGEDLKGAKMVITAGPTREYMDPVRYISNPSSGTMGVSIANEAYFRGADVYLVHGPLSSRVKSFVQNSVSVETTAEMRDAVVSLVERGYRIVIMAAAPADFRFKQTREKKIDSHSEVPKVELEKTPKISQELKGKAFLVGFSAETADNDEELIEKAKAKKEKHGFDIIIANNVARKDIGFASEYNEVIIVGNNFIKKINKDSKSIVARNILDVVKEELKNRDLI
ncbi:MULTISPECIES: bifunctional phosphopantothenoylcysteine decarboxylase/phosphopantothenate--cysteine ligase CoaBC [Metallosphaera]|uniref:Coenzyme A biosynthesis bifunctional protein CoaBC n=3 Tax=Metallosphaera TaxID=41980 RepID=A4YD19_METS5|nr:MULTISPECIES: bifunctional phosphopantothenoylcysteine decarboxylase/phosphopantothenate--cysteine ligase CoaBC [Metallosphaera]ABP94321.1 Phosphopantothenate-cysteine ligase [Metallosphaera sedula DSM 5348]AIM26308.1 Phosphopantothenate-cysteine ligase [Metallosphaera sedula]AKV73321.1 phosphopantothenoylcysteine decarboxylase [Metallosphaera sedula]AKV75565.1 phosphopantothenoylcysteine decarboxylase [Metallosphaera sedula]AKV77811.1 phosphopantothenoylcysteine decarboxylase [Metallosphae